MKDIISLDNAVKLISHEQLEYPEVFPYLTSGKPRQTKFAPTARTGWQFIFELSNPFFITSKISLCSRLLKKCGKNAIRRAEKQSKNAMQVWNVDSGSAKECLLCMLNTPFVKCLTHFWLICFQKYNLLIVQFINVTCFSKFRMKVESSNEILHTPNAS